MAMTINQKLQKIQSELNAPKNLRNSFGNYNYRNLEGIMIGFKPLGEKYNCSLVVFDELVLIGERYYIKATARLIDAETGDAVEAFGYAREAENKKGMDLAQVTGATSSYARKYACNGLLAIDDTKDADSDEYTAQTTGKSLKKNGQDKPMLGRSELIKFAEGQPKDVLAKYKISNVKFAKTVVLQEMYDALN